MSTLSNNDNEVNKLNINKVPIIGYVALLFAITFFSGLLAAQKGWITMFDFNTVNGSFGTMKNANATFQGIAGTGAREGFLFAITLIPSVMLALGIINVVDHLGGLKAAQKLLSPILRPLLGIPGVAGLALIASIQSMDASAGMARALRESELITEKEKTIFGAFCFSGGGTITNYFAILAGLFSFFSVAIGLPLLVVFVFKIFGANLMRLYLKKFAKGEI